MVVTPGLADTPPGVIIRELIPNGNEFHGVQMEPLSIRPGRRDFLKVAGLAGLSWLTPVGHLLARAAEKADDKRRPAQSIILLWMQGGPSQLETFDPHPGSAIAGGTRAIDTAVKGVQLAEGLGRLAEQME